MSCLRVSLAYLMLSFGIAGGFVSCSSPSKDTSADRDPHSFANHYEVTVEHFDLDLTVDFASKTLHGSVTMQIEPKPGVTHLILDTRDMDIERVILNGSTEGKFALGEPVPDMGQPLTVDLQRDTRTVTVLYSTTPEAAALQWLEPAQTAGGRLPFLFTQSQPILARSWIPCQDNPAVRTTYNARITVPPGMMALMSAENGTEKRPDGVYTFTMPQPITSYLLALAVGDIAFSAISERCGVFAEPQVIAKAAWELADTEKMMQAAETLYGPYLWGRYDVLVLPPSFPFGGMENPRLTFATPTILAGDRSLVSLIAHELAHSWSGNLVTNASWSDFWLNEGFTTYIERRIVEVVYGKENSEMQWLIYSRELQAALTTLGTGSPQSALYIDLQDKDPDDLNTDVAYEKGSLFLRMMEEHIGRDRWDEFLRGYFAEHAFTTMTTVRFLDYLRTELLANDTALEDSLKIRAWVYGPDLPGNSPVIVSAAFEHVEEAVHEWLAGNPARQLNTRGWTAGQWIRFVQALPESMSVQQMAGLDREFHFTQTGNAEILFVWLQRAIRSQYRPAFPVLEVFLKNVGRTRFLEPLYAALCETSDGLKLAEGVYRTARTGYHSLTRRRIDEVLAKARSGEAGTPARKP